MQKGERRITRKRRSILQRGTLAQTCSGMERQPAQDALKRAVAYLSK